MPGNEQGLIGSTINDKRHVQQEEEIILESRLNKSPDLKACRCANVLEVIENNTCPLNFSVIAVLRSFISLLILFPLLASLPYGIYLWMLVILFYFCIFQF